MCIGIISAAARRARGVPRLFGNGACRNSNRWQMTINDEFPPAQMMRNDEFGPLQMTRKDDK